MPEAQRFAALRQETTPPAAFMAHARTEAAHRRKPCLGPGPFPASVLILARQGQPQLNGRELCEAQLMSALCAENLAAFFELFGRCRDAFASRASHGRAWRLFARQTDAPTLRTSQTWKLMAVAVAAGSVRSVSVAHLAKSCLAKWHLRSTHAPSASCNSGTFARCWWRIAGGDDASWDSSSIWPARQQHRNASESRVVQKAEDRQKRILGLGLSPDFGRGGKGDGLLSAAKKRAEESSALLRSATPRPSAAGGPRPQRGPRGAERVHRLLYKERRVARRRSSGSRSPPFRPFRPFWVPFVPFGGLLEAEALRNLQRRVPELRPCLHIQHRTSGTGALLWASASARISSKNLAASKADMSHGSKRLAALGAFLRSAHPPIRRPARVPSGRRASAASHRHRSEPGI